MKADLTRNTFRYWKHITRVLMQQGSPFSWRRTGMSKRPYSFTISFFRLPTLLAIRPTGRQSGFELRILNIPGPNQVTSHSRLPLLCQRDLCENTPDPIFVYRSSYDTQHSGYIAVTTETLAARGVLSKLGMP